MGMYDYMIGNGIIIPSNFFIRIFLKEIKELQKDCFSDDDLTQIVKKYINKDFECCTLGHDAFEGRHGENDVFDILSEDEDYKKSTDKILEMIRIENVKNDKNELANMRFGGDLMFIGICDSVLENVELSWYVKGPEILYTLPVALKKMTKFFIKNNNKKIEYPQKFFQLFGEQESKIWTFHSDCLECCG